MGAELTLGVEEELHVVDLTSWQLSTSASRLLAHLGDDSYSSELQRSTVETRTQVTSSLDGLRSEITRLRQRLGEVAERSGLGIAAAGTAPHSSADDFELTSTGRYRRMQEHYRMLVDERGDARWSTSSSPVRVTSTGVGTGRLSRRRPPPRRTAQA